MVLFINSIHVVKFQQNTETNFYVKILKNGFLKFYSHLRPSHPEQAQSFLISEAKQDLA